MTAGLPGTGIGGLYYMLLVLWMPVREILLTLKGHGSWRRWGLVAKQWTMVAGILAVVSGEGWLLKRTLAWVIRHTSVHSYWHMVSLRALSSLVPVAATWISLLMLGGVILLTQTLRLWVRCRPPLPSSPPHRFATGPLEVKTSMRPEGLAPDHRVSGAA